jgi:hypothetical protein
VKRNFSCCHMQRYKSSDESLHSSGQNRQDFFRTHTKAALHNRARELVGDFVSHLLTDVTDRW